MQVSVEATGQLERTMKVRVPADEIEQEVAQRLKRMAKTAKIKGFRPGRIPPKVVASRYGEQVRQEVLSDTLQRSYREAIQQQELTPAGGPRIEPDPVVEGQDFSYTAVFEVFPEIELQHSEGLKLTRQQVDITDADVDAIVERLRMERSTWEAVERAAAEGDRVVVDFTATVDGESFEGGQGSDLPVVLGEGSMLEDVEQALYGVVAGEEKNIELTFPEDYRNEALAGRRSQVAIAVKSVERRVLPELDQEFAEAFGEAGDTVETLREKVRGNLERECEQRVKAKLRREALDQLVAANPVELPATLVEQEIEALQQQQMRRLGVEDPAEAPPADELREPARQRVALGLLVNELIRQQQIRVDQSRVAAYIDRVAADHENPEEVRQLYRSQQRLRNQIEMAVLEEQVAEWLIERAEVTGQPVKFKDFA